MRLLFKYVWVTIVCCYQNRMVKSLDPPKLSEFNITLNWFNLILIRKKKNKKITGLGFHFKPLNDNLFGLKRQDLRR